MPKEKTRVVMRAFVISQFSNCPSIRMFHDRGASSKINHIHERPLRIAYQDFTSRFAELLLNDNSVSIHKRNLQMLVAEILSNKDEYKSFLYERNFHRKRNTLQLTSNEQCLRTQT